MSVRVQELNEGAIVFEIVGLASTLLGIYLATQWLHTTIGVALITVGLVAFVAGAVTVNGKPICSGCGEVVDPSADFCPTCKELIEPPMTR